MTTFLELDITVSVHLLYSFAMHVDTFLSLLETIQQVEGTVLLARGTEKVQHLLLHPISQTHIVDDDDVTWIVY